MECKSEVPDTVVDLAVIIVNWNSKEYLSKCLDSIARHTSRVRYEVVVIDSGSFDGCGEMLAARYREVRFLQSVENIGFARANNLAARECTAPVMLFLNPDTELLNRALEAMVQAVRSLPDAGVVGARLVNSDGTVQESAVQALPTLLNKVLDSDLLRSLWPAAHLWGTAVLSRPAPHPQEVDAVSGACLMIHRDVFDLVGGFSEDYFMYAEDLDLAFKTKRAGRHNYYVSAASVLHHGGSSTDQTVTAFQAVMMPEATWRFFGKTRGRLYAGAYRAGMMASAVVRLAVLAAVAPVAWARGRTTRWRAAGVKWLWVMRWALQKTGVVSQYYRR